MLPTDLLRHRLANQHLARPTLRDPAAVVARLGAVQAQDYPGARWALGQRLLDCDDAAIERAFDAGAILRTHVMRPTWHLVAPADVRWLLALTAPRVHQANAGRYGQLGLDLERRRRGEAVFARALRGGQHLTRPELEAALRADGIAAAGPALAYLMMHAELEGVICSGPRRGKQFTYALLEERVAPAPPLDRDQALAELIRRYFTSHGPATIRDFTWWSGLTAAEARRGLEMNRGALVQEAVDGLTCWLAPADPPPMPSETYLLPNYDEYAVAYRDRDAYLDPGVAPAVPTQFAHTVVAGGRVIGFWRRGYGARSVVAEIRLFGPPDGARRRSVAAAAERYGAFLGRPVELVVG